jgi:hypothetical protein
MVNTSKLIILDIGLDIIDGTCIKTNFYLIDDD